MADSSERKRLAQQWEQQTKTRRPRLGPLLHRTAAELPHVVGTDRMRIEGGARLAFLSFYGVPNARTLVVHAAEPTSRSVSLLALDETTLRACVEAAGWNVRTALARQPIEAAGPLARWLGPRGSSVACKRRLSRAQWAETLGWLVGRLRLVGDKGPLVVCAAPVDADAPATPVRAEPELLEGEEDDEDLADLGLDAFAEAYYGKLREAAGAPGSPAASSLGLPSEQPEESSPTSPPSPPVSPAMMIADVYGGAREAALNAIDFEEVRLRTRRPLPNPRPHAQHLVLGARIDNIERLIAEKLEQAGDLSIGGVGLAAF